MDAAWDDFHHSCLKRRYQSNGGMASILIKRLLTFERLSKGARKS